VAWAFGQSENRKDNQVDGQENFDKEDERLESEEMFDGAEQEVGAPACREEDEPRLRRIADYESVALTKEDPFEAVMEAASAGLMRIEMRLQKAIERAMKSAPVTPERIRTLRPSFDVHLKYARQIDRFGQIVRRPPAASRNTDSKSGGDVSIEEKSEEMAI
jgi:hypothetical protein